MKKYILLLTALIICVSAIAQKTINDPNAVKRRVTSFHAVEVSSGIDLYLTQGNESVAVSATSEDARDKIITKVEDGVLKIYFEHGVGFNWSNKHLKAYVSFKTLDALKASGGSDVYAEDGINSNDLIVKLSGGSDFRGKISSSDLKMEASGGSDMYVSGKANTLYVEVSGGSDFHGYDLVTDVCNVDANGGSDVYITSNKEMNVDASGGSDVRYKGNGVIKNLNSSGSSSVKKAS
jgi:hypothetical protein